jgi:hypothetical protein
MNVSIGQLNCIDGGILKTINQSQASYSGDALLTTSYGDDTTARGKAFLLEKSFTIASAGTLHLLFDYTTFTPSSGELGIVYVLPPNIATTAGPVDLFLYRGTDYTGGTPIPFINPNTLAAKTVSETTVTSGPTGSVKGNLSLTYLVGGQSQGNQSASGSSTGTSFFILNNTKKSLVEIVNRSGQEITFHYGQILFEL